VASNRKIKPLNSPNARVLACQYPTARAVAELMTKTLGDFTMADRFGGTVYLGGAITQEQFDKCKELMADCLDEELDDDGSSCFVECTTSDFLPVVEYCIENKIALCFHWEAKYEEDSTLEYWVDGTYKQFLSSGDGDVAIRLAELQAYPSMTIAEFITKLDIPNFPNFEIAEAE
jgi:hypothetical protein